MLLRQILSNWQNIPGVKHFMLQEIDLHQDMLLGIQMMRLSNGLKRQTSSIFNYVINLRILIF